MSGIITDKPIRPFESKVKESFLKLVYTQYDDWWSFTIYQENLTLN